MNAEPKLIPRATVLATWPEPGIKLIVSAPACSGCAQQLGATRRPLLLHPLPEPEPCALCAIAAGVAAEAREVRLNAQPGTMPDVLARAASLNAGEILGR